MEQYIKTIINTDKEAENYKKSKFKEVNDNRTNFYKEIDMMKLEYEKELEAEKIRVEQNSIDKSRVKIKEIEKSYNENIEKLQQKYNEIKDTVIEKLFIEIKQKMKE